MADVLQRAADPGVTPRRILLGHPYDKPTNLDKDTRTTAPSLRVRPLPCDELPMPAKNRVGRDDRRDLTEPTTAQPVSMPRQPPPFLVGQTDPAGKMRSEDAVLFDQVGHGVLVVLVEPADQRRQEHSQRQRIEHGGRVYPTGPIAER